jgi:hypothetical protein
MIFPTPTGGGVVPWMELKRLLSLLNNTVCNEALLLPEDSGYTDSGLTAQSLDL